MSQSWLQGFTFFCHRKYTFSRLSSALLLYLFSQAELFLVQKTRRSNLPIVLTTWHFTWWFFLNLVNRRIGGEFSLYWLINKRFWYKFELPTLIRLEWSSLISYLVDINDQKSLFVAKNDHSPIFFFCENKDTHSKRERVALIDLHLKRVSAGCYH